MQDCRWLGREGAAQTSIYLVEEDPEGGCSARHLELGELLWHVWPTVGCYIRRRIFEPKSLNLARIYESALDLERKLLWAYHFRRSSATSQKPLVRRRPPPCNVVTDLAARAFAANARSTIVDAATKAERTLRAFPSRAGLPTFARFAMRWLEQERVHVGTSDKDGVLVLMPHEMKTKLLDTQLQAKWYHL